MDQLPGTSLARSLLALGRTGATGVVNVVAGRRARIAIVEGTPQSVTLYPDVAPTLGDVLEEREGLDRGAHTRALASAPPAGPIGRWLVEVGAASQDEVASALRHQLELRLGEVFRWPCPEYRFEPGPADVETELLRSPLSVEGVVLAAVREVLRQHDVGFVRRALGEGSLRLTDLGERLAREARLGTEEAAMVAVLRAAAHARVGTRGSVPVETLVAAGGGTGRAIRSLRALQLLRAVVRPEPCAKSYPLLLRKHRQVSRHASATTLLDLPEAPAPREARQALRRLAGALHPDRFADPSLRRASTEVVAALVEAEASLRPR
jgi:hypothetical protein